MVQPQLERADEPLAQAIFLHDVDGVAVHCGWSFSLPSLKIALLTGVTGTYLPLLLIHFNAAFEVHIISKFSSNRLLIKRI
jgi:hypothetical protein